jgi:PHS family inorganic phosphate transporter-like MFS transporter
MYGVELIILIVGALGCALTPSNGAFLVILALWRFVLGVGVGGDYPVSAVIASEFGSTKHRGIDGYILYGMLFSAQGC